MDLLLHSKYRDPMAKKTQRKNPKQKPLEAVLAAYPKRSALTGHALFRKIYDAVLTRSGLAAAYKRQGWLYADDEHWLDKAYEATYRIAHGREMDVAAKYALYGE